MDQMPGNDDEWPSLQVSETTREVPMITLDHTVLRVRDLEESIRFYQDVLGFKHEGQLDRSRS